MQQEQRNIAQEEAFRQKLLEEKQQEMDQAAFGEQIAQGQAAAPGGAAPPPPGGAPPAPGGADPAMGGAVPMTGGQTSQFLLDSGTSMTPDEMISAATSIAQQLLGLPESQRYSELRVLKDRNEALHSLVRSKLDQIRSQARSAGGAMLLGEQPPAPPA